MKKQENPLVRCSEGCGRLVRRSRLADHRIIAAAEHAQHAVIRQSFAEAYAQIAAFCEEVPS